MGKRRFALEVPAKAGLSAEIVDAGLTRITNQYLEDVEWADLFRDVTTVDIVTAYARTWRNTHEHRLRAVARRAGTRLRVYLPDPDDTETVKLLADRFNTTPEALADTIREAIDFYRSLATSNGGVVEVYLRPGYTVFSCYRFDSSAVLTLYSHWQERWTDVPTFVMRGESSGRSSATRSGAFERKHHGPSLVEAWIHGIGRSNGDLGFERRPR